MELQDRSVIGGRSASIDGEERSHLGRDTIRASSANSEEGRGSGGAEGQWTVKQLLLTISPKNANNVEALEFALKMRASGASQREISGALYSKGFKRTKAWMIATMAVDMA